MDYKIYPYKRGNSYKLYLRYKEPNGRKRNLSTGISYPLKASRKQQAEAKRKAEKIGLQMLLDVKAKGQQKKRSSEKLSNFLEYKYFVHVKNNMSENSERIYVNALNRFLDICGNRNINDYKRSDIQNYKMHRLNIDGVKKTTINIELRSIKAGFNWGLKNEYLQKHPFRGLDFMFEVDDRREELSKEQIKKLLKKTEGTMIGLVIRFGYNTGARIGMISNMKWKMVNFEERYINFPASIMKSNKPFTMPLNDQAFNIVQVWYSLAKKDRKYNPDQYEDLPLKECYVVQKEKTGGRYTVRGMQTMFNRAKKKVGIPKTIKFHSLRHSFATHLLENGADIYSVSKLMAHSSVQVTASFYDHTDALNYRDVANMIGQ